MKLKQVLLAGVVLAGMIALACVSREADDGSAGLEMVRAAEKFVSSLSAEQKKQTLFAFDDKERTNWDFVPLQDRDRKPTRKGLRLEEMTPAQKDAARALLKAGTSKTGYTTAITIMSLESILNDLEKGKALVRNPEWYFFTVFGTPGKSEKWGWRVEGHHLSLNFTLDGGKVTSSTPAFFGCNPATVKAGDRKGLRTLPQAEDLAQELFAALDDDQRKAAFQTKQFPEVAMRTLAPKVGDPVGVSYAKLGDKQKALLVKLVDSYAQRMPTDVFAEEMGRIKKAGWDKVYFAFAQETDKKGKPYTYRIQGPTFVIEFLNIQADSAGNPANHIHSVWRHLQGDFGLAVR